jgi:hypothetical protein
MQGGKMNETRSPEDISRDDSSPEDTGYDDSADKTVNGLLAKIAYLEAALAEHKAVVEKAAEKIEMIRLVYNDTGNISNQLWIELGVLLQQALSALAASEGKEKR